MSDFIYQEPFPIDRDTTEYRLLTKDYVQIVECDGRLSIARQFQLRRPADGVTLLRARTRFVCAELSSGRPKRMPPEFVEGYGRALLPA